MSGLRMRRQCLLVCRSGKDDTGGNRCQNYSRNAFSRKLLDSEHIGPHFSGSDLPGFQLLPAIITFPAGGTSISIALRKRDSLAAASTFSRAAVSTSHCILLSATLGSAPKESRIERPIAVLGVRWAVRLNGQAVGGCASKSPKIQSESEIGFVPRMTITNRTGLNVGSRITYMTWSSH